MLEKFGIKLSSYFLACFISQQPSCIISLHVQLQDVRNRTLVAFVFLGVVLSFLQHLRDHIKKLGANFLY